MLQVPQVITAEQGSDLGSWDLLPSGQCWSVLQWGLVQSGASGRAGTYEMVTGLNGNEHR